MIDNKLIENPLFHLNLMIFLNFDFPSEIGINPIFRRANYSLVFVEPGLYLPPTAEQKFTAAGIPVNSMARPEMMLDHAKSKVMVLLECKRSFFKAESTTARQARVFLSWNGDELGAFMGKPPHESWTTIVTYVTLREQGKRIGETLEKLSSELKNNDISPACRVSLELHHELDGLYLVHIAGCTELPQLTLNPPVNVWQLQPNEDPRTLYLIPYLPKGREDYDKVAEQIFQKKIMAAVVSLIGRLGPELKTINLDDELINTIIPIWSMWKSEEEKTRIRDYVRKFARRVFQKINDGVGVAITINNRNINLPPVTPAKMQDARRFVQKAAFRRQLIDNPLQSIFEDLS